MSQIPPWRHIVIEQLDMLASEAKQLAYESAVPHVDITRELICGWFNDSYHPDNPEFRTCFSPTELQSLAAFSAQFDQRVDELPESRGTVRSWLASSTWREVMRAASNVRTSIAA